MKIKLGIIALGMLACYEQEACQSQTSSGTSVSSSMAVTNSGSNKKMDTEIEGKVCTGNTNQSPVSAWELVRAGCNFWFDLLGEEEESFDDEEVAPALETLHDNIHSAYEYFPKLGVVAWLEKHDNASREELISYTLGLVDERIIKIFKSSAAQKQVVNFFDEISLSEDELDYSVDKAINELKALVKITKEEEFYVRKSADPMKALFCIFMFNLP